TRSRECRRRQQGARHRVYSASGSHERDGSCAAGVPPECRDGRAAARASGLRARAVRDTSVWQIRPRSVSYGRADSIRQGGPRRAVRRRRIIAFVQPTVKPMATALEYERQTTPTLSSADRRAVIGRIVRVAGGNFLEMYDFIVYGYYATYIADTFFPVGSQF